MTKKILSIFLLSVVALAVGFFGGRYDTLHRIKHQLKQDAQATSYSWNECNASVATATK